MSIIRKEQLSNPLSASYAATASFALNAGGGSIDTGSLVTTSSFNAYTASINSFTSSINTFTASYSTGSFTGSFTGSLLGTSSWAVSASQALSASFALTASYVTSNFQYEIHVSQIDGNDTTGDGSLLKPVATITKALTLLGASRKTIIIHPGTYSENVTVANTNTTISTSELTGANTLLSGTLTIGTLGSGTRISGLKMSSLVISGTAQAYISNCTVDTQVTKSSSGYVEIINSELQCTLGIQISGAGTTIINGNKNVAVSVSNASAQVIIKGCNSVVTPSASAGNLAIVDCIVTALGGNGITITGASTTLTLLNSQVLVQAGNNVAPISVAGIYSIINTIYDKPSSTLTGISTNSVDYFQYIDADNITTKGLTVTGSMFISGAISASLGPNTVGFYGTASWAVSASQAVSASFYQEIDPIFVAKSASLATTGSNVFVGNQTITGSLVVTNNFTVLGSASIQYISESTLNIGTNLITVNTNTPSVRFGGLAVIDSGSSPLTSASFLYDAVQDEFIFVHKGDGTNITSSHFILGPETYNDLGNETYLTANRIPKGKGNEHLNDSNISDNGTLVNINSNTNITGSLLITGSQVIFSSSRFEMPNNIIVNSTTRRLNSGSALSVDWGNRTLHTSNNATTIDWQNRYLNSTFGISIDWGNYNLYDTLLNSSLDWSSRYLNTNSERIALDWNNDYVNSSNTYLYREYNQDTQDNFALSIQYSGETIYAASTSSAGIDPVQYQLVSLSGSYWLPTNQTTDISTKMLGIVIVKDATPTKGIVLLEGDISFDGSDGAVIDTSLTSAYKGQPVYIRLNADGGQMSLTPPTSGYVRIVGYIYYQNGDTYIFRFKPSNDWYKLS